MQKKWALILGASSGFGGATAVALAKEGYNILGIHLDRQITMPNVNSIIKKIEKTGQTAVFFNMNAADQLRRNDILDEIKERFATKEHPHVHVLVHSLAFGTLKPYIGKTQNDVIAPAQMSMTLDVMAHTLVYWTQGLIFRDLFAKGGRIFALTSAGSQTVIPNYGAVSAAKAALEAHIRQLSVELGPMKITANAIMAGVTDTPALSKIPGSDLMLKSAKAKNPQKRLTTPEDVASAILLLCRPEADWISGNVIGVDGAEYIVNYLGEK
ncbi:MAG: SDR family oxidoreductase [Melioribacteraceae bacterium]|jgi:NAD(P)-dependent dehydrogenase (short-subunit alcohol dehydrogenase family)|nr:SDR family oxidoreductase [Melioribacteraceae bacterium]RJP60544.1 MAG: SDR family oxidoreductase [Ignavibacteriales bacterium]WKZ70520.1 MAG: SDR family oxidoreductase [Melioribacteraceae bacterium]